MKKNLRIIVKNEIDVKRINRFSRMAELGIPLLHGSASKSLYSGVNLYTRTKLQCVLKKKTLLWM
jgi:hypothetical protein